MPTIPHMTASSIPDPIEDRQLAPLMRVLAEHGAQQPADMLRVRHQHRAVPPALAVEPQCLAQEDADTEDHESANEAEHEPQKAIHRTEQGEPHEMADDGARRRSDEHDGEPEDR